MRFKEEVFSKIFTYITVILLLGVIIFEAWSLQSERARLKNEQEEKLAIAAQLEESSSRLGLLEQENEDLRAFQTQWIPYAAFLDNSEVMELKTDLFTRPDLIPEEAIEAAREKFLEEQEALLEEPKSLDSEDEEEQTELEFGLDNPDGEDIFLPLSTGELESRGCLIYTVAYEKNEDIRIELLFEVDFDKQDTEIERDENGEVDWKCVAYNVGQGWVGRKGEEQDGN